MAIEQVSQEELAAEQAATQVAKEEEIRTKVIGEFGFDETNDAERIDKMVKRELESQEKLSKAIQQKIKHRNEAEGLRKNVVTPQPNKVVETKGDLSTKDVLTLVKNNIPEEDIDEVVEYAKFKGISVSDAIKHPAMKATLNLKAEERTTAQATNTSSGRRSNARVSDEALVDNARKGNLPDSDDEIARLITAKYPKRKE